MVEDPHPDTQGGLLVETDRILSGIFTAWHNHLARFPSTSWFLLAPPIPRSSLAIAWMSGLLFYLLIVAAYIKCTIDFLSWMFPDDRTSESAFAAFILANFIFPPFVPLIGVIFLICGYFRTIFSMSRLCIKLGGYIYLALFASIYIIIFLPFIYAYRYAVRLSPG